MQGSRRPVLAALVALAFTAPIAAAQSIDAVLDSLQYGAFRYAWDQASPSNGLLRDRSQIGSPCSIAAQGFGLSAICIAIDHGWVSRPDAATRVLTTLQTYWNGPQGSSATGTIGYKGLFYHFLDLGTATRTWESELSTIDTALLLAGILDAKQYFDAPADPTETQIRSLADSIYRRVDWNFMRNGNPGILMGWKPGTGFSGFGQWIGYNEAMILYVLAIGSPTHPVPSTAWNTWTSGYNWNTQYGYTYVIFPPLFGHQYSHCWIDFRDIQDAYMTAKGITYFENSRRATLAQQAYCIANPFSRVGYSATLWGLTASDGPTGYNARGAPPAQNDDGTITPTAPISSIPFAPEIVLPTIQNLYDNYKAPLWGPYGFRDAFNLTVNPDWYDTDVLGIDQGPITIMIENYRNQAVWNRFMRNQDIVTGLLRAGFTGPPLAVPDPSRAAAALALGAPRPNPSLGEARLDYTLPSPMEARLEIFDVSGRRVAILAAGRLEAGPHAAVWDGRDERGQARGAGLYLARLDAEIGSRTVKLVRSR